MAIVKLGFQLPLDNETPQIIRTLDDALFSQEVIDLLGMQVMVVRVERQMALGLARLHYECAVKSYGA